MTPSPSSMLGLQQRHSRVAAALWACSPGLWSGIALVLAQVQPWLLVPAAVFIGTRLRQVSNLLHWASHGTLCRSRRVNRRIGDALAFVLFTTLDGYRREHLSHHARLGQIEHDLDFRRLVAFGITEAMPWSRRLRFLADPRLLWAYRLPFGFATRRKALATLLHITLLGGLLAMEWWFAAAAWLLAWLVTRAWISYLTDVVDHAGIYAAETRSARSRNCIVETRWLRALLFPAMDCYHLVHHEYPGLGPLVQADAHAVLMHQSAAYRARPHRLVEWLKRA